MAAPILPDEFQNQLDEQSLKYRFFIHTQRYAEAEKIARDLYDSMVTWQNNLGRLHKGFPLHNIGYALHYQEKHQEALYFFMLAYIEDLLSADDLVKANDLPAGKTLIEGYKYNSDFLKLIRDKVAELKTEGKPLPERPEAILLSAKGTTDIPGLITVLPKERPVRTLRNFGSDWDKRVFIGGSGGLPDMFDEIAKAVEKLGYDPVIAVRFENPNGMSPYYKCLLILHSCKYAIFDLTQQRGQLLEVERSTDYGVRTLLVWNAHEASPITSMLTFKERGFKYYAFEDTSELEEVIRDFLQE
jgi:hypothetical protein